MVNIVVGGGGGGGGGGGWCILFPGLFYFLGSRTNARIKELIFFLPFLYMAHS